MPNGPCAPPGPTRKPVMTSSNTSSAPAAVAARAQPARGSPASAGRGPCWRRPARRARPRGRRRTAANAASTAPSSLNGTTTVSATVALGDAGRARAARGWRRRCPRRRAGRRGGRGSSRRTSGSCRGRWRRARGAPRSSPPRCPTTRAAPSRPTRHAVADRLGQLDLARGGRAERRAVGRGALHRLDDLRVGVAEDRRAPRLHVVEVAAAVGVDEVRALAPGDEERRRRPPRRTRAPASSRRPGCAPAPGRKQVAHACFAHRALSLQALGELAGEVGEHEVGAGALDRE